MSSVAFFRPRPQGKERSREAPDGEPEINCRATSSPEGQAVLRGIGEGIRLLSKGYLLQWQMLSSFWEVVFAFWCPAKAMWIMFCSTSNSMQIPRAHPGKGGFVCSHPKVASSNRLQSLNQSLGCWSCPHLEK